MSAKTVWKGLKNGLRKTNTASSYYLNYPLTHNKMTTPIKLSFRTRWAKKLILIYLLCYKCALSPLGRLHLYLLITKLFHELDIFWIWPWRQRQTELQKESTSITSEDKKYLWKICLKCMWNPYYIEQSFYFLGVKAWTCVRHRN